MVVCVLYKLSYVWVCVISEVALEQGGDALPRGYLLTPRGHAHKNKGLRRYINIKSLHGS